MKKKTAILSILVAASLTAGIGAAAYSWNASDVAKLQQGLLTSGASAEYDLDGSGETDIFDLGLLKRELIQGTGEVTAQTVPATAKYVKLQSRTVEQDGVTWLVQSGAAVECIITAESASVTLAGSSGIGSKEDYRPRYGIYVDGELLQDQVMGEAEETVTLWEGGNRTAEVKVMLLSEAMYGGVGVKGFDLTSGAPDPVKPVPARALNIEFIGDSITCAYGVEGASESESFRTTTENFSKSYAYLTAQQLGADYGTCCYSGHGIVSGYSQGEKNAESLIPDCYGLSSKFKDYGTAWDFSAAERDAVVINLGTNDINYVAADPETRNAEFIQAYVNFLGTIREQNPKAAIICTVGTMGGKEIYELIEEAVAAFSAEHSDAHVLAYFSKTHSKADGLGSDWHPSAQTQQNSAYVLADKICQALGIESDQIGLDVAADAAYDLRMGNGANAAHYVSDFDKSFWINTVTGGSSPEDIEGVLSGIHLKKNGRYVLSFDTTGGEAELPVCIQGTAVHLTDTFSVAQTEQHFEAEFTAAAEDDVEILFQVGGRDSYNLTLKNIKLTKIG